MKPLTLIFALLIPAFAVGNEWNTLFNGKNLNGWKANAHAESFTVDDGVLKVHGKKGMAHLFYVGDDKENDTFTNFEFSAMVRSKKNSNSGIFFHTSQELRKRKYLNRGYEVQLNSSDIEKRKTGSLYAVKDLAVSPVDETKWFELRFRVEGKRIQVFLNSKKVIDYTEPPNPKRMKGREKRVIRLDGGAIAIQAHDPKSVFYFKNIRVRRIAAK